MPSSNRSCNYELIAHHFQLLFQIEARPRTQSSPKLRHTQKRSRGWHSVWIQSGTDNSQISLCSLRSVYKAPHRGLRLPAADQSKQSLSADPLLVHRSADHPWVFMILWAFYAPDSRRGPVFSVLSRCVRNIFEKYCCKGWSFWRTTKSPLGPACVCTGLGGSLERAWMFRHFYLSDEGWLR